MADKPESADDRYTDEETAQRRDATIRAMIATPPKPHQSPTLKAKTRPAPKRPVDKGKPRT